MAVDETYVYGRQQRSDNFYSGRNERGGNRKSFQANSKKFLSQSSGGCCIDNSRDNVFDSVYRSAVFAYGLVISGKLSCEYVPWVQFHESSQGFAKQRQEYFKLLVFLRWRG